VLAMLPSESGFTDAGPGSRLDQVIINGLTQ